MTIGEIQILEVKTEISPQEKDLALLQVTNMMTEVMLKTGKHQDIDQRHLQGM